MALSVLRAHNVRLFGALELTPSPTVNVFVGPNATGKTTVLEMIHLLSRGRSFRTNALGEVAGGLGPHWGIQATFSAGDVSDKVRVRWQGKGLDYRTDANYRIADMAHRYPVQMIDPGQHRLIEDGPIYRRRFLDWGVFHVEHRFLSQWQRYRRALRQRNAALKVNDIGTAIDFDTELATAGEAVHAARVRSLTALEPVVRSLLDKLLGDEDWAFELRSGWGRDVSLIDALGAGKARDQRQRQTVDGPHRAELKITKGGAQAKARISRGQQKLLVVALALAQCEHVRATTGQQPIVLVDDFGAELARDAQARLDAVLQSYRGQRWITALDVVDPIPGGADAQLFHVEHGAVKVTGPL